MHVIMAGDMCVCALLYEQNKVLLEGCEKELEGCRRSQYEVSDVKLLFRCIKLYHSLYIHISF